MDLGIQVNRLWQGDFLQSEVWAEFDPASEENGSIGDF